jgi:hypothetical protein
LHDNLNSPAGRRETKGILLRLAASRDTDSTATGLGQYFHRDVGAANQLGVIRQE